MSDTLTDRIFPIFDHLLDGTDHNNPIGVAVSGGGDSMALLALAYEWAKDSGRILHVFSVDHGLRAEAKQELALVTHICNKYGLPHQILYWEHNYTSGENIPQQRARRARHMLLAKAMHKIGGQYLLLGHTQDDQAETFLLRARRHSNWAGLAGMSMISPSPIWPDGRGVRLCRPFLGQCRQALRQYLRAKMIRWCEDPSNRNLYYMRVQARSLLVNIPSLVTRITGIQNKLSQLRRAGQISANRLADSALSWPANAMARLDIHKYRSQGIFIRQTFLSALLQAVSGRETAPEVGSLMRLDTRLMALPQRGGCTLGGTRLVFKGDYIDLVRDPGGVLGQANGISPIITDIHADKVIWDGRYQFTNLAFEYMGANIRACGTNWKILMRECSIHDIPAICRDTLPILHAVDGRVYGITSLKAQNATVEYLPPERLRTLLSADLLKI